VVAGPCRSIEIAGKGGQGRPTKTWREYIRNEMKNWLSKARARE